MDDLIKRITKKTGVTKKQAEGGLVALRRPGGRNLAPRDVDDVEGDVPGRLHQNLPSVVEQPGNEGERRRLGQQDQAAAAQRHGEALREG